MKGASSSSSSSQFNTANTAKLKIPVKIKGAKGPLFFEENEFKTPQIVHLTYFDLSYLIE